MRITKELLKASIERIAAREGWQFDLKTADAQAFAEAHPESFAATIASDPRECPYCERIMSRREAAEQGACDDCTSR